MPRRFFWDPNKAASNERKHGVSFREGVDALLDPNAIEEYDDEHSESEDRYRTIGMSTKLRILLVVHTDEEEDTWIISVRRATKAEQLRYEQGQG